MWEKRATIHVPEWVRIRVLGWRESIRELALLLAAGFVFGFLAGLLVCWYKADDWRFSSPDAQRIYNLIK